MTAIHVNDTFSHCLPERLGSGAELGPTEGTPNKVPFRGCVSFNFWFDYEAIESAAVLSTTRWCQKRSLWSDAYWNHPPKAAGKSALLKSFLLKLRQYEWKFNDQINYNSHASWTHLNFSLQSQENPVVFFFSKASFLFSAIASTYRSCVYLIKSCIFKTILSAYPQCHYSTFKCVLIMLTSLKYSE